MRGSNCGYPFGSKSGYHLFFPRLAALGSGVTRVPVGPLEAGRQCRPAITQGQGRYRPPLSALVGADSPLAITRLVARSCVLAVLRAWPLAPGVRASRCSAPALRRKSAAVRAIGVGEDSQQRKTARRKDRKFTDGPCGGRRALAAQEGEVGLRRAQRPPVG
jgi:hypothetical protein